MLSYVIVRGKKNIFIAINLLENIPHNRDTTRLVYKRTFFFNFSPGGILFSNLVRVCSAQLLASLKGNERVGNKRVPLFRFRNDDPLLLPGLCSVRTKRKAEMGSEFPMGCA